MASGSSAPLGWPKDLPPPGSAAFEDRVVGWLLDRAPGEIRTSRLRGYPVALATYVEHHVAGCLSATRRAYGQARVELSPLMEAAEVQIVQQALEAEGARLLQVEREVRLVARAVRGEPA